MFFSIFYEQKKLWEKGVSCWVFWWFLCFSRLFLCSILLVFGARGGGSFLSFFRLFLIYCRRFFREGAYFRVKFVPFQNLLSLLSPVPSIAARKSCRDWLCLPWLSSLQFYSLFRDMNDIRLLEQVYCAISYSQTSRSQSSLVSLYWFLINRTNIWVYGFQLNILEFLFLLELSIISSCFFRKWS